jgi:hypothetical protein
MKDSGLVGQYMDLLVDIGLVDRSRLVSYDSRVIYHAWAVYRTESGPYLEGSISAYHLHHRSDSQLVRRLLAHPMVPWRSRSLVIVIQRVRSAARSMSNYEKLLALVSHLFSSFEGGGDDKTDSISNTGTGSSTGDKSRDARWGDVEVVEFSASGHVRDHVELFRRARVVIGVHGAGLANQLFCGSGTHVVEIGYDQGMPLPDMYMQLAAGLDHQYWLVLGKGGYDSSIEADLIDLEHVIRKIKNFMFSKS